MNKKIGFAVTGLFLCIGLVGNASEKMTEGRLVDLSDQSGMNSLSNKRVLFRHDENGNPTSVRIADDTTRQAWDFVITRKGAAGCGSEKLEAVEEPVPGNPLTLEVIDHSGRRCDDYKPYQWEMILKEKGQQPRHLVASPAQASEF